MFSYKKFKGQATITSYDGNEKIVHIPSSIDGLMVVKIAAMSFFGNEEVEEIHFPNNVSIENNAIVDCPNLRTIYISKVCRLGNFVEDCDNVQIVTDDASSSKKMKNRKMENINDVSIFEVWKTSPTTGKITNIRNIKKANGPKVIHIPNIVNGLKVTEINEFLFANTTLDEVILNDYIEELPSRCFNCATIKTLKNLEHIKKVGENCFNSADIEGELHFPNLEEVGHAGFYNSRFDLVVGNKIKEIATYGFAYSYIKEISLPKLSKCVNRSAFESCEKLERVNLPKTIEVLHSSAFEYCPRLREIKNINKVKEFHGNLFCDCDNLVIRISFDNGKIIHCNAFYSANLPQKIEIKNCTLEDGAFSNVCNVKKVIFTDEYKGTIIPNSLFYCSKSIEEVILNKTITSIEKHAFRYSSLKKINLDEIKFIDEVAFADCNLKSINLPNVETINSSAFEKCFYLKEASFYGNKFLTEFSTYLFYGSNLERIVFPDNLKIIGFRALYNCNFKNLILPSTVEELRECFIGNNPNLQYLEIPSSVKIFKEGCLSNFNTSKKGTKIVINGTPELIKDKIFYSSKLKNSTLDLSNCKIEEFTSSMFEHFVVKELILPKGVKKVCDHAFHCAQIQKLVIDYDSIEEIENSGFASSNINNLQVPKNVKIIGKNAYFNTKLELDKLEIVADKIGESAFWSSGKIKEVIFKSEPKVFEKDNFERCGITKISATSPKVITKLKSRKYFKTFACEFEKIK